MPCKTQLAVDESRRLNAGSRRIVYLHPRDDGKILKLFREDQTPARRRSQRWYGPLKSLDRFDDNGNEYRQFKRITHKGSAPPNCICNVFGYRDTTMGRALVVEHVRNADGRTSDTLGAFVRRHGAAPVLPEIDVFFDRLADHHVVARDPHPKNILVREEPDGALSLVLIDGFGDPNIIPLATMSKSLNRKKLMRKKSGLIRRLRALEGER